MRILFIQPYPTFPGVISDTLPGQLARRGHEVSFLTFSRQDLESSIANLRLLRADGVSVSIPNLVSEFPYLLNLQDVIRNCKPDIVHANYLPFLTTWQATKTAKKLGVKVVAHVHGIMGERTFLINTAQKIFIFTFGHSIFSNADKIICLNQSDAMDIQKYGAAYSKIAIIPNGIDINKFIPRGVREENTILWSGRFVREKGLEYLIKAIDHLVNRRGLSQIRLFLAGDGLSLPQIQELVRRFRLEQNVKFLGRLSRVKVANCMSKYSIFVLSSTKEGMPYSILEAMSSGMSVIASDLPGLKGIVTNGETGLLVPPKDAISIANAIEKLLDDKALRNRLGANARDLMVRKYGWNKIVREMESLYEDLITRSQ